MPLIPPIISEALADSGLTAGQTRTFLAAVQLLDFVEPRPLKLVVLSHQMSIDAATVSRALSVLVERRYLVRLRTKPGADPGWVYRLPFSREEAATIGEDERAG